MHPGLHALCAVRPGYVMNALWETLACTLMQWHALCNRVYLPKQVHPPFTVGSQPYRSKYRRPAPLYCRVRVCVGAAPPYFPTNTGCSAAWPESSHRLCGGGGEGRVTRHGSGPLPHRKRSMKWNNANFKITHFCLSLPILLT